VSGVGSTEPPVETAIRVDGVGKAFGGQEVLRDLSFTGEQGTLTAVLGPSGSGKTTLLRIVAGLEHADTGTVILGDRVVDAPGTFVPPERRRIGYVPQEGALFPHLNVVANIAFGLERGGRLRRPGADDLRVRELVDLAGLTGLERRLPHQLSGGERQRVALARALAPSSGLVLLDEPFSSLDAELRASLRAEVVDILRRTGATAVLVTHDQEEALSVADSVVLLQRGTIVQHADPVELYERPATREAARFVGHGNLLHGRIEGGVVGCSLGSLAVETAAPDGSEVDILVRPEQVGLVAADAAAVRGVVVRREFHGYDVLVRIRLEPGGEVVVARLRGRTSPAVGDRVGVHAVGPAVAWARPLHSM
jgi:iron(III) transport system ATP-binding protein